MSLINGDAGRVSYSGSNIYAEEPHTAQATVQPDRSANAPNLPKLVARLDVAINVQKRADDNLAWFLADVHNDIGLWRQPSANTSVGKWLSLYNQSWDSPAVQAWVKAQKLVPGSLRLQGSTLTAQKIVDGKLTNVTFTPADATGWWPISRQVIASAAILDPQAAGLVGGSQALLQPADVMAFYGGATWPLSHGEANNLWINGFAVADIADDPLRSPLVRELASREFMDAEQEAALIKTVLSAIKGKPDDENIDLGAILQDITPGSSFNFANKSKPQLLKNLRDLPQIVSILREHQLDSATQVRLVDGELFIKSRGKAGQWHNLTKEVRAHAPLAALLDDAIEQAKHTGNVINSGAKADALQLLRFSGMDELPAKVSVKELRNRLNWRLNPLPPGTSLGNYARDFLTYSQSPGYLSPEQRARIRRSASGESEQPTLRVFDCSPQPWSGQTREQIREHADQFIVQSLTQGAGLKCCEPILATLKDDPSSTTVDASPSYRQQMILTRDLLCIDPELGLKRNHIAGYDLYSASNTGKTLLEVRVELEQHLCTSKGLSMGQAVLITHALLATVAPEFLVKGAEEERVGSLSLVNLRTQTALVELTSQGSSREMNTAQVSSRAFLTPFSSDHEQLQALETAGPVYDWAIAQGVVAIDEDYSLQAVTQALTSYNERIEDYNAMSLDLDNARSTIGTRLEFSRQEFERVCPGNDDFFKKRTIYHEPDSVLYEVGKVLVMSSDIISGNADNIFHDDYVSTAEKLYETSSIYDLYLSGVLTAENVNTRKWKFASDLDKVRFESLKSQLSTLKPINEVFYEKFDAGLEHFEKFKSLSTRMMMSEMPLEDRSRLEWGDVIIFGVSENLGLEAGDVTKERAQQQIGPIIFAKDASGSQCYEFLPSTNSYILRPNLLLGMNYLRKVDIEFHKTRLSMRKRHHPSLPANIDIKGYFPATTRRPPGRVPNTYSSMRTNKMIQVFKNSELFINRRLMREDAKGTTHNESIQQRFDAAESFIVNTIIPFKGNLEDILSGEAKRVALGMLGLGLEVFGTLFVVGGAVKAAAKGASITFKLATFGKALISMFNLPGAVMDTGKSVFRLSSLGIRRLGKANLGSLGKGIVDIRKLVLGGHKHSHSQIRRLPKPWTTDETINLAGNTGLINTGIGTTNFALQPPPGQSAGSVNRFPV